MMNERRSRVRSPQNLAAGLFLIALGCVGMWQGADLAMGSMGQIGPGMLPRALSILTIVCGLTIAGGAVRLGRRARYGAGLERWSVRGPLFVLGSIVVFGLAVRPLGLLAAGPLALAVSSMGSDETRPLEVILFVVILTLFCLGLFVWLLGLPIPIAPWLINR